MQKTSEANAAANTPTVAVDMTPVAGAKVGYEMMSRSMAKSLRRSKADAEAANETDANTVEGETFDKIAESSAKDFPASPEALGSKKSLTKNIAAIEAPVEDVELPKIEDTPLAEDKAAKPSSESEDTPKVKNSLKRRITEITGGCEPQDPIASKKLKLSPDSKSAPEDLPQQVHV